jgi:hypothetical protein
MAIVIPSSIYQATPTEKAQLYNSLLSQGYSDEEIRVAAGAPRDDNWALLQSIAQSLQPAQTPAPSLLEVAAPEQATSLLETPQETANTAQQANRPTAVLFGDSMSEYVGYTADGNPDNKYGNSVADVISNNLGIDVTNLATGGETSNEALAGGAKFGAFQSYIEKNKPEYAIIRYGAADAIKNQDPATTLQSVQQMVDIAKANGVTPIIVGVSELYGAQNSKTGNIAGYIDPGAEKRANQINDGLKQIAQNAGVSFTDVRAATSAGTGDLLDGVHSNADFGKKMADAISEDIAAKGVIAEAKVPSLPANVDSLSNAEKGRLYNDLIGQGFTDAQIRTAARAESDQDWNALKQIAADVKNITPAQVEKQAQSSAAPEGLLSTQTEVPVASRFSGLFASGDVLANKAQEVLASSGKANDPRFADAIVGSFTQNGINYNVLGDGSMQGIIETPTGAYLSAGFTPTGQQATEELSTQFEQTSTDRLLGTLANAAIAAGTAAGLGPAGVGFLSTPAAAAVGAGTTSFANSGDLAQALRAAALGGAAAFGIEQLFPTAIQTAANTAVDLAGTGASQTEIVNALVDQGVRAGTAAQMAGDALAGATARQIATEFASSSIGGTAAGATSLAPNLVEVATSTAAPGLLATAAPSLAGAGLGAATTGLLGNTANQSVNLDVSRNATGDTTAPTAGLLGATPGTITSQSVPLDVTRTATTTNQAPSTGAAVGSITSQSVPLDVSRGTTTTQTTAPSTGAAVGTLTPMQSVPVESRTIKTETPSILAPAAATVITTPRGEVPVTTYEVPRSSTGPIEGSTTINPLLALGLLGLAGTALGGGSTAAPFDQAAYDAIAKGRSPVYPRGQFTPISLGGLPGMGGVGGIPGAYDYFGPYYGAGRFGARPQAFALPGLLGPNTGLMATPSRSAAV